MKKQAICEYCNKVFEEKISKNGYGNNYQQECVEHEITHLNLKDNFEVNLLEALKQLDNKYESTSSITEIKVSACWDSFYGKDITYSFQIYNNKIEIGIDTEIVVSYNEKEKIPTKDEIINQLEHHFFIPTINQKYEGVFSFEGFAGGNGADDYIIGNSYMSTIYDAFKGKKVRIEIIE